MKNTTTSTTSRRIKILADHLAENKNEEKKEILKSNKTASGQQDGDIYAPTGRVFRKGRIQPLHSIMQRDYKKSPTLGKNIPHGPQRKVKWNGWGYTDTEFLMKKNGMCHVNGDRYLLSGNDIPKFRDYFERYIGIDVSDPSPPQTFAEMLKKIPEFNLCEEFIDELKLKKPYKYISTDAETRLLHGHGHSSQEIFQLRYGRFKRIPDLVIYPSCHDDVVKLVKIAQKYPVVIIPYGGGTTVTQSLMCPENEKRMIISVDTQVMNRIKWIDAENNMACIEAGAMGKQLQDELAQKGWTLGHEPDSYEFSTMGGWVATRASGMKKNKYGNVEDFLLRAKCVTSIGVLDMKIDSERKSTGPDLQQLILGSEGTLGIITDCIVRISKAPECHAYGSVLFPDFESGFKACREISSSMTVYPASVRLMDNIMFAFGQALKMKESMTKKILDFAKKVYVTKIVGFNPEKMCAMTLLFEGTKEEVKQQENIVYKIAKKYNGLNAGGEGGENGYMLTYVIAYLRDYGMAYNFVAESFECTVPWKYALALCKSVRKRVIDEARKRGIRRTIWCTYRLTQTYKTCCCLYFYFGFNASGIKNVIKAFSEVEEAARHEILEHHGTLSHHHGVGKLRKDFMKDYITPVAFDMLKKIKQQFDPKNVFGNGNMGLTPSVITVCDGIE